MKKSVAILTALGLGATALAVLGKKMLKNDGEATCQPSSSPLVEQTPEQMPTLEEKSKKTDPVMPLSMCYFTQAGTVWHADRECFYIKTAAEIFSATPEHAMLSGKAKPCSRCVKLHNAE